MKTKEFIRRVEELGFDAEERGNEVYLYGRDSNGLAKISKKYKYTINTLYRSFIDLNEGDRGLLFDLIFEYISTPADEREEEKKFYLRHKFLESSLGEIAREDSVVNYNIRDNVLYLADKQPVGYIKTFFTLKEIEEIKEKLDTDLADFDLVEVEDDY